MACVTASVTIHQLAVFAKGPADMAWPIVDILAILAIIIDDHGWIKVCHLLFILYRVR
jgi:hypothetical protein